MKVYHTLNRIITIDVYVIPDQWHDAWAEAVQMALDTGCWVTLTFGYGLVAVNLDG